MVFIPASPSFLEPSDSVTVPQFMFDEIHRHPTRSAKRDPDIPCLIDDDTGRKLYPSELQENIKFLAAALRYKFCICSCYSFFLWVSLIHKYYILANGDIDFPVCIWAVHHLGGVISTLNPALTANEIEHHFRIACPRLLITHRDALPAVLLAADAIKLPRDHVIVLGAIPALLSPSSICSVQELIDQGALCPPVVQKIFGPGEARSSIAFLAPSSGTTGIQKCVAISHYNVVNMIVQIATFNRFNDSSLSWEEQRFRPGDVCSGCTFTLIRIHDSLAAAPLRAELAIRLLEVLPNAHCGQGYGMTETCGVVSMFSTSQRVGTLGSCGRFLPGTTAKIVGKDGQVVASNEVGEVYVYGGQMAMGYHGDPEAFVFRLHNVSKYHADFSGFIRSRDTFLDDGWLRTGDIGKYADGELFILDRIKVVWLVNGFQVPPAELEGHLLMHDAVADAAVIGVPHGDMGEVPKAFIVLRRHIAKAVAQSPTKRIQLKLSIFKHVSNAKAKYKWLVGGIEFVGDIPKNQSGKILRRLLRDFETMEKGPGCAKL
ncbi:acetyl-CoA synthetase-like protein [Fistulina hepatica ATCC 64428]|uniref:Acetyl-CoA synthetase-like protein n=1 Tax=Fistulina hepatica ATCC 64428 TaxID=1128425 RepID=A0A0D7AMY6_9AGAR|nr:acetyl-CoA synthetase-like protein [Fistulina hepatica ATCC 64428]